MQRVALIDADILVYRCAASLRKKEYRVLSSEGEMLYVGKSKKEAAEAASDLDDSIVEVRDTYDNYVYGQRQVDEMIAGICNTLGTSSYLLFVTGDTNFRNDVATIAPYKGNRPERPRYYQEIKDYLWSLPGLVVSDGCEADDMIGIYSQVTENCVICSLDKDLDMLPGQHYNFVTKQEYYVSPEDGLINFYRQIITGDKVDNIIGINGVGPVKAAKAIHYGMSEQEMFNECLVQYGSVYTQQGNESPLEASVRHVTENGKLLWIWRKPNDLWNPDDLLANFMERMND